MSLILLLFLTSSVYCAVKVVQGGATFRAPAKKDFRDGNGDLNPGFVYKSPFINGEFGQGVVIISMGSKQLILDFRE